MKTIEFAKLHGDENDFLLSWDDGQIPDDDLRYVARRICARTTGVGADGWMLVWPTERGLRTRLFNSDGSEPEISGNGTRCAAAFAIRNHVVAPPDVTITTAAGPKNLRLLSQESEKFTFEMDMGQPEVEELQTTIDLGGRAYDATILNVGNPQCVIFAASLPPNWRALAAEAEGHPRFPHRSNVSFVQIHDRHHVEATFFERGAGETRSSGTGSTGAAVAAMLRGYVESPVEIRTPAGSLRLRWAESVYLTGPAEFIAEGTFFLDH
jgi:diaminopimelate epimerase